VLPKKNRLKKKKDFEEIIKKGSFFPGSSLSLKVLRTDLGELRIGFVVSQKISKSAVVRNRIKRRLREAVRSNLAQMKKGYDIIFFSKKGVEEKDFWEIKEEIEKLLKKAKLIEPRKGNKRDAKISS